MSKKHNSDTAKDWWARQRPEFRYALDHPQHLVRRMIAVDAWSKDRILSASGLQLPPITTPLPWSYHAKMRARTRSGRLRRAERQRFTLSDVIERDGWRCGICGKTVDPRAKGRDRKSLDHVIPICMGGSHTLANAQLAHLGCNSRKGARLSLRAAGGDAIVSLTQTEGN